MHLLSKSNQQERIKPGMKLQQGTVTNRASSWKRRPSRALPLWPFWLGRLYIDIRWPLSRVERWNPGRQISKIRNASATAYEGLAPFHKDLVLVGLGHHLLLPKIIQLHACRSSGSFYYSSFRERSQTYTVKTPSCLKTACKVHAFLCQ